MELESVEPENVAVESAALIAESVQTAHVASEQIEPEVSKRD